MDFLLFDSGKISSAEIRIDLEDFRLIHKWSNAVTSNNIKYNFANNSTDFELKKYNLVKNDED